MSTRSDGGITLRLRRIGTAFVEALQLRHELLSMEMRDERGRLVGLIFQGVLGALLLCMAFLFLNLVALLHWWDQRVAIALGLGGFYLLAGVVLLVALRDRLSRAPAPFAGTIEELRKDVEALSGKG